jgi:copper resistance protein B
MSIANRQGIKTKANTMNKSLAVLSSVLLASSVLPVWAADTMHMGHETTPDKQKQAIEHHKMEKPASKTTKPTMNHAAMGKGMNAQMTPMQGGSAPADARDPHEYSGGYSIESGKYALSGPRQLVLADEYNFGSVLFNRLESVNSTENNSALYDMQAWYGRDYERLVLKAEGSVANGGLEESSTEVLWGHAIATYWDAQLGVRYDTADGPERSWLAFGMQGLAPYWFEVDITGYIGEDGRSALGLEFEYEILFSQKLILQPRIEADLYAKDDAANGVGAGLSEVSAGLRLRYEFSREFAPYIGVEWAAQYGNTAELSRAAGLYPQETRAVAGVRFWF